MAFNRRTIRFLLVSAALALAACGLAFAITRSVAARDVELWAYDFLVNHGAYARMADDIVIVDFDDDYILSASKFPVPRDDLAKVITQIASAGPRVIGLDFFLTERRDAAGDTALQQALTQAGNVIVASQLGSGGLPGLQPLPFFCQPEPNAPRGFCQDGTGALGYAFANTPLDNDGYVRSMLLLPSDQNETVSFPLALAQQYSGKPIHSLNHFAAEFLGRRISYADPSLGTALVSWNQKPALRVPALAILHNNLDLQQTFAGKVVLIGQSSDAARDRFLTPVFRPSSRDGSRRLLSGVEVNAAAIHTLLDGPLVSVLSPARTWTIFLLVAWLAAWLTLRLPVRYGFVAVALAMLCLYGGAQLLLILRHSWMKFVGGELALVLVLPLSLAYQFVQERFISSEARAERQLIMNIFSRYVSREVAEEIWQRRGEIVLAGEERTATVLFSDIRSFTGLSAGKASQDVLQWLNRYFTAMDEVVTGEDGYLNKFIGDGLMVLFGVPLSKGTKEDACCAVRCALRMLKRVEELNAEHAGDSNYARIQIGIGIHTGCLTCGNVGSARRLEYSVIGENVNLASRLESLTKELHTSIVLSADTEELIRECFPSVRHLGEHPVRGLEGRLSLYTVEDDAADQCSVASAQGVNP